MYSYKNMLYFLHQMCGLWLGFVLVSAELASVSKTEIPKVGNLTIKSILTCGAARWKLHDPTRLKLRNETKQFNNRKLKQHKKI